MLNRAISSLPLADHERNRHHSQLVVSMMSQVLDIPPEIDQEELRLGLVPAEGLGEDSQTECLRTLQQALRLEGADDLHALFFGPGRRGYFVTFLDHVLEAGVFYPLPEAGRSP